MSSIFHRAELLLGHEAMSLMATKRVILFGVGGVGSWCAEGLVRSGIHNLTIVDYDRVVPSNINRQLMATTETVGLLKTEALRCRLLSINPAADITAVSQAFTSDNADTFHLDSYDYIIDAIDSLPDKALLILTATQSAAKLFSSMGAALKLDPTCIRTAEFWRVEGDPLARALRRQFKRNNQYPARKFTCVFSDERQQNKTGSAQPNANGGRINGSLVHITAIFGFTLAALVVQDIIKS